MSKQFEFFAILKVSLIVHMYMHFTIINITFSDPDCYKLTRKTTPDTGNPTFMTDRDSFASVLTTIRFNVSFSTPVNM